VRVPQMQPFVGQEEYEAIKDCFDTNWLTEGPKCKEFVRRLCDVVGVNYGVLAPNCTLGLFLGLKAMGIGPGDEVIVPNFTFIASATSVILTGATPVFVDINKEDLQINIDDCKRIITEKTKAIMPVHMYGASCNMTELVEFANKHELLIIEDAAQAIGVNWEGKPCGSFGAVSCFSFFADKSITTIEGGFIGTNDEKIYESLRYLRNHGRISSGTFIHPELGFNFRMNDVSAAIGLVQLDKAVYIFSKRLELHKTYCRELESRSEIKIFTHPKGSNFVPFRFSILYDGDREALSNYLTESGIEPRTFFYPLHRQPAFEFLQNTQSLNDELFTNSVYAYEKGLCFPVYPELSEEQVVYTCDKIKEFLDAI